MKGRKNDILFIFIFPVLTGILLGISALPSKVWFFGFVAFIPLLIASDWTVTSRKSFLVFLLQLFIALVVFYLMSGLWVLKTANLGFLIGFLIVLPYLLLISPFIVLKKRGSRYSSVYFIAAWLASELVQSYFQLGSPFFDLGNNPGSSPRLIQWYCFTGAAGGSLWILAGNFGLLTLGAALARDRKQWIRKASISAGIIFVPMILSLLIFYNYRDKGKAVEVLIVHPSTDCRDVKYQVNIYELMDIYLGIMMPQLTENTEYVVLPETALTNTGWVADLNNNLVFDHFRKQTAAYPNLKLVTGAIIYDAIPNVEKIKGYQKMPGIRYSNNHKAWYRTYNAAMHIENNRPVQMRVKEGLVPFQEYTPYPRILPRILPVGIDFQFSKKESNAFIFTDKNRRKTAALICYELVYGNLFNKAARKGAEAFFVLLNEGWYANVAKVKYQFLQLSAIRAIENRRSIAHASNMGISAFIDQRGIVILKSESKQPDLIGHEIRLNNKCTLASKLGNYPGALMFMISIFLISSLFKLKK